MAISFTFSHTFATIISCLRKSKFHNFSRFSDIFLRLKNYITEVLAYGRKQNKTGIKQGGKVQCIYCVLFISRRNDLAFTAENKVLIISEHQSTINQNMPLRDAIYYGRTMEKLLKDPKAVYRRKRIMIPTPKFFVFYNGNEDFPSEENMKLSDSYLEKGREIMLELIVKVININLPNKHAILEQCRPLYEYSWFIQRVKEYLSEGKSRDEATIQAIKDCKKEGIMTDFMYKHGSEAENMLFGEYDEKLAREVGYEEGFEDGEIKGRREGHREGHSEGLREGLSIGEMKKLIKQVHRKVLKGKSTEVIAEELEEAVELVESICAAVQETGTDASVEEIYAALQSVQK